MAGVATAAVDESHATLCARSPFSHRLLDLGIVLPRWYQGHSSELDCSVERMRRAGASGFGAQASTSAQEDLGPRRTGRSFQTSGIAGLDLEIELPPWRETEPRLRNAA